MSGDVQPRKRKDKKRKKDDLGLEEPRGTAAALGEGDVFMHSYHEHGTGGHWCAKIIFFSLLAVLITLIGLIILENRGLTELEANAVESRYSGVLEGWLEDAPDDDHHDEHTLELNHPDEDDDDHREDNNQLEDEDHDEDDEDHDDGNEDHDDEDEGHDEDEDEDHDEDRDESVEQSDEANDDDDNEEPRDLDDDEDDEAQNLEDDGDQDDDDQDLNDQDDNSEEQNEQDDDEDNENDNEDRYYSRYEIDENEIESNEIDNERDEDSIVNNNEDDVSEENFENFKEDDEDEDEEEHEEEDTHDEEDVEVEKLEREDPNEEPISMELPALPEDDDHDDDDGGDDENDDGNDGGDSTEGESDRDDDEEFLENDDDDEPAIERITAPPGKPFIEMEEEVSSEQPPDTLAEEEEYEKRQEELRREEEQSSHMWLKLTVGGALLVATHAVMRRATQSRDSPGDEEPASREETPLSDRRMTLIPEDQPQHVPVTKVVEEILRPRVENVVESAAIIKPALVRKQESEEEEVEENYSDEEEIQEIAIPTEDNRELYSDEEEADVEEEIEEPKQIIKQSANVVESKPAPVPEPEEIEDDDVEIIDDEQLEEELEEEDEEEISDVDDAELLTRLEAKYGRLPEPERPGQKNYKDGGNSIGYDWPGEPSDAYWRDQLDSAERELAQGAWSAAAERASNAALRDSARARWIAASALDRGAEEKRDNTLLSRAITAYLHLLKMNERLSDKKLLQITERALDRIQFRGNYLNAEPVYRLLIRRFPNEPAYRNNLTISFLMANRVDLAEDTLKETLKRWPNDRVALAHYGFVLKTKHNRYEEAAEAFQKALEGDKGPANEARFYYHYGDSLLLLGRHTEAHEVHKRGAALGHFLSPAQRSLYNVPRLKSTPWWKIEETPYANLAKSLEKSWREILKEAEAAKALYEKEKEGLKERGEWSQLDLFVRGREIPGRCERAPVTCSIVKSEIAAAGCRRGQIKFSAMAAGTHVRPHVGPTNCRLRMHLGLSNTKDTYLRVDQETRQWQEGKTLMFDDSFEHEVWHNGTGTRLVLIVDVWHPNLTQAERRQLPAI